MQFESITKAIIGSAYQVYNEMGFGFLESVYEKCMVVELRHQGLVVDQQVPIDVTYKNHPVGKFMADLLVENEIIVELKSVRTIARAHEVQLVNYLTATSKDVGLLINFGEQKVEIKRKVRSLNAGEVTRQD